MKQLYDVAIIGAGIAGMATVARLQAQGMTTVVLEAHGRVGGCAGYFRQKGFAFDVGATTLVDFERGGVGGELLDQIGMSPLQGEQLPGYVAWLPDRTVTLHRDPQKWSNERLQMLGASPAHQAFWTFIDRLAHVFWEASRKGIKLPMHSLADVIQNVNSLGLRHLPLGRYLLWTMGDALRAFGLRDDPALCGLLAMLIEDTVHSTLDDAPLINSALGITIRGAGLTRHQGGMYGFWKCFTAHYRALGGEVMLACRVQKISGQAGAFLLKTSRGEVSAKQVVSTLPPELTATLAPEYVKRKLQRHISHDARDFGGAVVVFLGVPESEVAGQAFTHHQLLQDYAQPLGDGNNMFISVSSAGDTQSAPEGYRAVMISTHCELSDWEKVSTADYPDYKRAYGDRLIEFARRVYPTLASNPVVYEIGTPQTYQRFTSRPRGAVGGLRLNLSNSNQNAIPQNIGVPGFWLAGDSTFPGLGTVACVLGSKIAADHVSAHHQKMSRKQISTQRRNPYVTSTRTPSA
ncbi:MAG: NAD(P)/FAD-dependent oxidoreductase [Aggregatilineales bacterium]